MPFLRILAVVVFALPAAAAGEGEVQTPVGAVQADDADTVQPTLDDLLWVARPLVVFADTENDPRFRQQMEMLQGGLDELEERKVVVLTDVDPAANGALRRALRARGFGLVLIDTDGSVIQRRPSPTTVRELTGTIDRLPSRRQEIGSRRQ